MYMQGGQTGGYGGVGGGFPGFPGGGGGSGFPGGPGGFPGGGGGPPGGPTGGFPGGPTGGFPGGPFMGGGFPGGGGTNPGSGGGGFMGGGPGPGNMSQVGNMGQFGGGPMGGGPMGGGPGPMGSPSHGPPPGGGIFGSQFGQPGSDLLPGPGGCSGSGPGGGGQFQRGPGGPGGGPGGPGGFGGGGGGPGRGGKGKNSRKDKGGAMSGPGGKPSSDQFNLDMGGMGGGFGGGGPYPGKGQQFDGGYGHSGPQHGGAGFGGCGGMPSSGPDGGGRGKGGRGGLAQYAGGGGKGPGGGPGRGGGQPGSGAGQSQGLGHSNLFIGNLPEDANEGMLREAFAPYGNVVSCRLCPRNGRTCALVKMGSVHEAEAACRGVSRSLSGDQKSRWLVKFADSDVGGTSPGLGLGGGKGGCPGGNQLGGWGKGGPGQMGQWPGAKGGKGPAGPMPGGALGWAPAKGGGGPGGPGRRREREQPDATPSDNLYVKGLPPRITETQLNRTFSKAGKVVELKILRYGDSLECAALVRMATVEAAKSAIESLNGTAPEGAVPRLTIRYHGKDPTAMSDNLYVKGLPLNFTQDHLHLLFGQCGTMRRSRILQQPNREQANGEEEPLDIAALVQMSSAEEAARVIQMLNGRVPDGVGPQMTIRYAEPKAGGKSNEQTPSDNLYVKGLPLGTPDFLLRAVFAQFGTVVRLKVLEPRGGEAMDCAALVQMSSISESQVAVEALHGKILAAPLPPMRVRFAGKDQQPGSNLYVAGLPLTIHEQQLRNTFATCGTVVRLRMLVQTGRPETHALVQMHSQEEAEAAIQKLHGQPPESMGPTLVVRYATNQQKEEKEAKKEEKTPAELASIEASLEALQMK